MLGIVAGLLGTAAAFGAVSALVTGGAHATTGRVLLDRRGLRAAGDAPAPAPRASAPACPSLRTSVASGRRGMRREGKPLWQRLYLDLVCLAVSGLIYWLTASTGLLGGRQPRLQPDAVAVGVHVLRPRAAVDRRHAAARAPARTGAVVDRRARRRPGSRRLARAPSCWSAPGAAARRSTAGWSSSGCCSPSA